MGPLVPYGIISGEFNFIIAIILGVAFGFILEQAGFGSSRKLAGVFYGYDFVVLRVFFTAAITAMTGLIFGNYFGIIDINMVYINPTFVWSIIIGGVIMGVGFVVGGFCPGTSLAGAATGKIDAMFFIGGILIGVLIFGEMFPVFEPLYKANALGPIKIYNTLGISQGLFAFLLIIIAVVAFYVTRRIENKINNIPAAESTHSYAFATAVLAIIAAIVLFIPAERKNKGSISYAQEVDAILKDNSRFIHTDELAFNLMHHDFNPVLVDIRTPEEYKNFSLPGAINIPLKEVLAPQWRNFFRDKKEVVIYSNSSVYTEDAYILLHQAGIENIRILQGGLNEFFYLIFEENHEALNPKDPVYKHKMDMHRFRARAAKYFQGTETESKPSLSVPSAPKVISVEGGC